ncbi:MAG: hypothetical protein HGA95_03750 [Caldiserica bacterium]|nr:hypothetical protein [Caldisericota bacterium]
MNKNNKMFSSNNGSFELYADENNSIRHFPGRGARKILLDLPLQNEGLAFVALETNELKIWIEDGSCIVADSLLLPGRVIDKFSFVRTDLKKDAYPQFVGFVFLVCDGAGRVQNSCHIVGVRQDSPEKLELERLCSVPTECSKVAHVFLDKWQVPEKIMLAHPNKSGFDIISVEGSQRGFFDFETECLPDRYASVGNDFFIADKEGLSKWRFDGTELVFVERLPLEVEFEKAFMQKGRVTPQTPDDQEFYTGSSIYFLYNGVTVEIEDAKDVVGYNFVVTEKGVYFIDGWPDDELVPRYVTQKKLKPLLFDWVEREKTPFRAFFLDEDTNELIVFSESGNLEVTKISGIRGRILDVSVNFEFDMFMIYTMEEAIWVSDFGSLPKFNVEYIV